MDEPTKRQYHPMTLKYVGRKPLPYELKTPIPYIAHSDWDGGMLSFNPTCFVKDANWVEWLLTACGDVFEPVIEAPVVGEHDHARLLNDAPTTTDAPTPDLPMQSPYMGRKFMGKSGKWNAIAFLRKKQLVDKLGIHRIDGGWELVPITEAEAQTVTESHPVTA